MRIASLLCAAFSFLFWFSESSNAQSIELYAGYSFVRASVTPQNQACSSACPAGISGKVNLNGWEGGAAFKFIGPLALKADFSGTSGTFHGANTHLQTYLIGAQVRFPGPISPFAHFLVGAAHEAVAAGSFNGVGFSSSGQNALATAIGGGLDLKVLPFISLRPIQFDYLLTRFNSSNQHQPRISAGIVVRF